MARPKGVPKRFTAERRAKFLAHLAKYGYVTYAAKAAGIHRDTARDTYDSDPAFHKQWDDALNEYTEHLEMEADRRAYRGVLKPIFQGGKKVGVVREFSDTLLIFRLKGLRPEVYAERQKREVSGEGGGPVVVEHKLPESIQERIREHLGQQERG